MGYNTYFEGQISIEPPLNEHEISFLNDYAKTRHTDTTAGALVVNHNAKGSTPQHDRPEIWLHWVPTDDGTALEWDEKEKTYGHDKWLVWLIKHLLGPDSREFLAAHLDDDPRLEHFSHDHVVSGIVYAQGEDYADQWRILASDNVVQVQRSELLYREADPDHEQATWPTTPAETASYRDWQYEVANGDTLRGFREWLTVIRD